MTEGQRVRKRGLGHVGTVAKVRGDWITVEWDQGEKARERPRICQERELEPVA